jgi:hypothetical protein
LGLSAARRLRFVVIGLLSRRIVKKLLRILAAGVAVAAGGLWLAGGANGGWTKTNIKHETPDPVTGLTGVTYEKGFVPGVDFLAGAALAAGALAGASFFLKTNKTGGRAPDPAPK